jgi:hypothetical protein
VQQAFPATAQDGKPRPLLGNVGDSMQDYLPYSWLSPHPHAYNIRHTERIASGRNFGRFPLPVYDYANEFIASFLSAIHVSF